MFSCNLPPTPLAEWPGSFRCYCGTCVEHHDGVVSDGQASWDEDWRLVVGCRRYSRRLHLHLAVLGLETRLIVAGMVVVVVVVSSTGLRHCVGGHGALCLKLWTVSL